jgi:hypothetical protein
MTIPTTAPPTTNKHLSRWVEKMADLPTNLPSLARLSEA